MKSVRSRSRLAAVTSVLAGAFVMPILVVAGAGVLMPGTQPNDGSGDPAFPAFTNTVMTPGPGRFDQPGRCDNCHAEDPPVDFDLPWDQWAGSMMANSARDPLFWAALDIANQDDAALGDVDVGDYCLRCHVPQGWYEGRSKCTTPWGEDFDGSCFTGEPGLPENDFEGISCSVCHRMYDASNPDPGDFFDAAAPYRGNAQVYYSNLDRTMRGPFSDAVPVAGVHEFADSAFHRGSALCGQCHDVTHPTKNRRDSATGADLGYPFPIERTYTEWTQSLYADASAPEHQECQGCHMPPPDLDGDGVIDDREACSVGSPGPRGPATVLQGPLHMHGFAGANAWMLGILRDEYGASLNRVEQFNQGIARTLELLQQRTVQLGVTAPATVEAGAVLDVDVRVTNLAGHKFPTGYPEGRRAFVSVAAGEDLNADRNLDAAEVQFRSAYWDPATGVLDHDAQARVYEAQLGVFDFNGTGTCDVVDARNARPMFHFALNDCTVLDNRIPPRGFRPDAETAPVGHVYPPDPGVPGALAHWDDVRYAIPVLPTTTGDVIVEVRVRYQSTSSEYIEFLRDENVSTCDPFDAGCDPTQPDPRPNRGEKMHALWVASGRAEPVDLAIESVRVRVTPPPPEACCLLGACSDLAAWECEAMEGDAGGAGSACATTPCTTPVLVGEASHVLAGAAPLLVRRDAATGRLDLSFDPACNATDHALYWGALPGVATLAGSDEACGLGIAGSVSVTPGPGNWWFLVVGRDAESEGSYGRTSLGAERPERLAPAACGEPQALGATCN